MPAREFWSAIVYSMETKGFIANASRVGISSYEKGDLKSNSDGTMDLYFGPKAPEGLESNWIPTGEDYFLILKAAEAGALGPIQELADGVVISDPRVLIADGNGKKFEVSLGRFRADIGDKRWNLEGSGFDEA